MFTFITSLSLLKHSLPLVSMTSHTPGFPLLLWSFQIASRLSSSAVLPFLQVCTVFSLVSLTHTCGFCCSPQTDDPEISFSTELWTCLSYCQLHMSV